MKKITLFLAAIMIFAISQPASANIVFDNDERQIEFSELPAKAQEFVKKNFPNEELSLVILDSGLISNEYDVIFTSGVKLEFKGDGEWENIKCRQGEVPAKLVPAQIADFVAKKYSAAKIIELKREHNEWEVKLNNGLELTFDKQFKLIDIDD